jgi:hypothetical protein
MASRAHSFHDYSFGSAHSRPRQLYYRREDPVQLPRTSIWRAGGGALVTAVAMGALVIGSAYAALRETPPPLVEETPALPPLENWQPDPALTRAHVLKGLQGPAMSVPEKAASFAESEVGTGSEQGVSSPSLPPISSEAPFMSRPPESREVIIDDSKMYPPTSTPVPYPDPTTTPPDVIAPPEMGPSTPAPDPENPYRD